MPTLPLGILVSAAVLVPAVIKLIGESYRNHNDSAFH
jgi:hypothetical protein